MKKLLLLLLTAFFVGSSSLQSSPRSILAGIVLGGSSLASGTLAATSVYNAQPNKNIDPGLAVFAGWFTIISASTGIPALYLLKNALRFK